MLIKTKYIDCASKSVFNTWKLPTSAADTSGDIYWSAVVYIKDTGEVWTHGKLYGGFFSNADNNKVSLTIGGTTKILALDGHVQSYTTLTGSGSTADQAILSTGEANKWTLKTLGKNAFSNVDYLPADATAVAAEKVVHALAFQYNGKAIHSFDGSVARVLNIIQGDNVFITGDSQGNVTIAAGPGSDTVNTAGATNKVDTKLFLIGAESQTTAPQTYSNQYVYIGTDNCLYSLGKKVLTEHQAIYNLDLQTQVGEAVTKVTTFDPNAANNSFTLVQGTNVTLTPDAANKKVTISSKDTTYDFYNLVFKQGESVIDTYKPTTSPSKTLKAGTNVTFTGSNNEVLITTQDTRNTAGATEKLTTKLFLTGALTQTDNPQTYTNSKVYIGADNKLYSDGKVVSTGDHTHKYAGATSPGGPALKVDLNPSGLLDATYGSYGGILQDSNKGPVSGSWSNRIKILHNNSTGYYTELAQNFTGTAGLWHRRNVAGTISKWTPVIDNANFHTYLDSTYVIRGNDPNVLTNYVRYSINTGLTMNWEWGNATPTHIWGAKASDSSKAYVFNGDNIRAFANAVNRAGDTMTGTLKVTEIQATNGNGLVMWNGTTYTYLGMQAGTTYIRSGETDLQHRYNGTDYKIWDARNLVGLRTEHSHNTINFIDSRETASTPQEHAAGVWLDFKANAKANLSDGGNYTGLLTVRKYGGTTDWSGGKSAQLGFTDNSNVWVRFGTGTSWEAWKQLATTGWADGKFLPLAGGTVTGNIILKGSTNADMTNANIHPRLRFDNSDSSQTVSFIFTDYDSYRAPAGIKLVGNQGNEWFEAPKLIKTGSSDSYVLLGGGGHKALAQFVYAAGNLGVQESTGTSDNISRAQFWRDNNLGAYGVTLSHSDNAGYKTKIYHDYGSGGNLYMKACSNGTWGSVYTIWNSGNFDPNTKVNKAGDTMTGTLGMGANTIYWKENGFGDKFGLTPYFSGANDNNYLAFMSSVGEAGTDPAMSAKMVLTGLGNVGIGTTTPTQKLHVIGGGLFTALLTTTGITNNGTLTQNGDIIINQASTTGTRQVRFQGGDNDYGRVAYGGTASNAGWMEIASCDDGNEPIYARQYTGVFTTVKRTATLLDANGNTVFPGTVTAPTFTGALNGTAEWSKRLATNSQLTFGLNGLTYFNAYLGAGTAANQNVGPTAQWWHILRMNHGNGSGYFADIAVPLNTSDGIYWRRIQGGTNYGWYRVLDTNNYAGIIDGRYVNVTGDTMTGALHLANGTRNNAGNDCGFGDCNIGGCLGLQGLNGATGLAFIQQGASWSGGNNYRFTWNGSNMTSSSTAQWNNLNADLLDGYHQTAFSMGWTTSTKYRVDRWGGGQDKNWKKIVTYVSTGGGQYLSCKVKGTIYYITGNHNQGHVIDIPFEAIMYAYGGTANSMLNQSTLYLPPYCSWDLIRIVRYANNSWEVQVRQPSDWTNISLEYTVTNNGGSVSAGQFINTSYSSTVANNYNTNVSRPTSSYANRAASADRLTTARSINGTNFDGTANITTSYWGTARNFTIGNTTRSVNGSGNVTWSFADIGGAPASHSHNYINSRGNLNPQTGRTQNLGNVYSYNTVSGTSNGAPTTYASVIGFGRSTGGTVEIAGGWTAGMGLWYRALRDTTDNWYGWVKVWDTKNFDPNSKANSNHNHDGSYITKGGSNNNVVLGAGGYRALSDFTLNSNWAASKDVSGYVKFPNGFIIQWGEAYVGANSTGYKSFPIAFPTACISVQVTHKTTATNWDKVCVAGNYTRTSCTIANGETVNSMINWMALGY